MTRNTLISIAVTLAILEMLIIWLIWSNFWRTITFLGSGIVITVLTVVCVMVFAVRAEWRPARQITFVMVGAVVVENGLKWIVHRAQPDEVFAHTMPLSYSFPSGHSLFAMAFYISFATIVASRLTGIARTTLRAVAVLLVILIGASRIFLGVHYPSDVLGGYVTAVLWMTLFNVPFAKCRGDT